MSIRMNIEDSLDRLDLIINNSNLEQNEIETLKEVKRFCLIKLAREIENVTESKQKHYVYMITDTYYGFIYIGKRSCFCEIKDDDYMGSGTAVNKALKDRPKDMVKEILHVCDSKDEAECIESAYLTKDFANSPITMNQLKGNSNNAKRFHEELTHKYTLFNIGISLEDGRERICTYSILKELMRYSEVFEIRR